MKRHPQTRGIEHRQIVGAIADGNRLSQGDALRRANLPQSLRLPFGIDHRAADSAGDATVHHFELVREQ